MNQPTDNTTKPTQEQIEKFGREFCDYLNSKFSDEPTKSYDNLSESERFALTHIAEFHFIHLSTITKERDELKEWNEQLQARDATCRVLPLSQYDSIMAELKKLRPLKEEVKQIQAVAEELKKELLPLIPDGLKDIQHTKELCAEVDRLKQELPIAEQALTSVKALKTALELEQSKNARCVEVIATECVEAIIEPDLNEHVCKYCHASLDEKPHHHMDNCIIQKLDNLLSSLPSTTNLVQENKLLSDKLNYLKSLWYKKEGHLVTHFPTLIKKIEECFVNLPTTTHERPTSNWF